MPRKVRSSSEPERMMLSLIITRHPDTKRFRVEAAVREEHGSLDTILAEEGSPTRYASWGDSWGRQALLDFQAGCRERWGAEIERDAWHVGGLQPLPEQTKES